MSGSIDIPRQAPKEPLASRAGGNRSAALVSDHVNRYRLSTLVFDDADRLWRALAALLDRGVEASQLCLAGAAATLNALRVPADIPLGPRRALDDLLHLPDVPLRLDGNGDLVARGGAEMTELLRPTGSSIASFEWMQEERSHELAREAEHDGVILLVSARSADELAMSAGILLRHGRHSLQTHVFARRKDS